MEANALPLSLPAETLHAYLADPYSPLSAMLPLRIEDERLIVLGLREVLRSRLGLPPLSEAEKANFRYSVPVREPERVIKGKSPVMLSDLRDPPQADVDELVQLLVRDYSELVRGVQLTHAHNADKAGQDDLWLYPLWATDTIDRIVRQTKPDLQWFEQSQLVLGVLSAVESLAD